MRIKRKKYKNFEKTNLNPKFIGITVFVIIILFFLSYAASRIYRSPLFLVTQVLSNEKIAEGLKKALKGKSLFQIDTQDIYENLIKDHPEYEKVFVLREFPSSVRIEIERKRPFAQWKGKHFYLLDRKGMVISDAGLTPFANLIPIEINDYKYSLLKGFQITDKRLSDAFSLIEELQKDEFFKGFSIQLINPTYSQSLYFIIDKLSLTAQPAFYTIKVIVGEGNFSHKIYWLKNLLKKELKDKLASIKYIDLRYKKVYVGFAR